MEFGCESYGLREVEGEKQGVRDKAQTVDWFLGCHFSGPFAEIAHFGSILMRAYKENILGLYKQVPLGGNTLGQNSFWGKQDFSLEKKIEEKRELPFPYSLFLIFFSYFSLYLWLFFLFFKRFILFSRVLM